MSRVISIAMLLLVAGGPDAASQIARCRLAPRPYGFGGVCRLEQAEAGDSQPARIRLPDSVRVWLTAGPDNPPPWRGNLSLPGTEVAFEIAPASTGSRSAPLVLRTGIIWLTVKEWDSLDPAQPPCAACERLARDVVLVLDLTNPPPITEDDIVILGNALAGLGRTARWNRQEVQNCSGTDQTSTGLFCLLYGAVEARMGRYHHRQPALDLVRSVILERWRDRITSHQLVDFNNHPATTLADMKTVLQVAIERATQAQAHKE